MLFAAGSAIGQDRIVVQQAPAEMRRGTDADPKRPADLIPQESPAAPNNVSPTISLLLADGSWRVGRLESIGSDEWRLAVRATGGTDIQRIPSTDAIAFVVRRSSLRPALGSDAESRSCAEGSLLQVAPLSLGVIDTIDGQRLPGTFRITNGGAVWDHRWIGTIPVALDRIASLRMIADRRAPGSAEADTVLLVNGDIVRGFIDGIGEEITLAPLDSIGGTDTAASDSAVRASEDRGNEPKQPQHDASEDAAGKPGDPSRGGTDRSSRDESHRRIPMERVAALALADMPADPRSGTDIWTADGSIVGAEKLGYTVPTGWSFTLGVDWLRAIRSQPTFDNQAADPLAGVLDRGRFLPLAACRASIAREPASLGYRYRSEQPARLREAARFLLGCTEIEIDGPSALSFDVPDRFRAANAVLTGMISIAEPCPTDVRVEIAVSFGGSAVERIILDGNRRCHPFTLRSQGSTAGVTISVGDAGNGVAGDRIVLERAALIAPR